MLTLATSGSYHVDGDNMAGSLTMEMAVRLDQGSGSPVVLLHGFPGNGADWETVAARLTDRHRTVVVDLLGFGSSPTPDRFGDLWTEAQAEALAATFERLGLDQPAVVGHDMGGPVALTFLRQYPRRLSHLALISTNTFGDTPVDFPLSLMRLPGVGRLLEPIVFGRVSLSTLGRIASKTSGISPAPNNRREARTIRTIFAEVLRQLPHLYKPIEDTLPSIDIPTVVIWGDRDMFFSAAQGQRTADAIPGAEFVLLPECGHFPPIERPEAVASALLDLLARDLTAPEDVREPPPA
jgi:pimeloyl-ACP methyl ester carboxylesterase